MKEKNSLNTKGMISVCLAAHNGSRYIKRQVESILQQLGDNDELIISDDGSTDNTLNIVGKFSIEVQKSEGVSGLIIYT